MADPLEFAEDLASRTGALIAEARAGQALDLSYKDGNELLTSADLQADELIRGEIEKTFPAHNILSEESSPDLSDPQALNGPLWIVDPIDGTVNFSHGMPFWCCSIAVREKGGTVAGAVYGPDVNELYTATADRKSTCNGEPIFVSEVPTLDKAMIMTGVDQFVDPSLPPFAIFKSFASNAQKVRVMGSAALDICRVANGAADGYFEAGIYLWDVAAAQLIVEQAGGKAEILYDMPPPYRICFAASNGLIHSELTSLVDISSLQEWKG